MNLLTQRALDATARYQLFLDRLRRLFELAVSDDPTHGSVRLTASDDAKVQAQEYLAHEGDVIRLDTYRVGEDAYVEAAGELGQGAATVPVELDAHFGNTGQYLLEILAAQAGRDITTMSREINAVGIRVDMSVRAGKRREDALAAAIVDSRTNPDFRFMDRAGRRYDSTKHVRDQYRLQLLTTRNEGFLYAMSEAGVVDVQIKNPNPQNKWNDVVIAVHDAHGTTPSYYDIRDEVFHPSSDSYLTMVD